MVSVNCKKKTKKKLAESFINYEGSHHRAFSYIYKVPRQSYPIYIGILIAILTFLDIEDLTLNSLHTTLVLTFRYIRILWFMA